MSAPGRGEKTGTPYVMIVATNRRARHDFHVEETCEAGLVLHGSEVKSLRLRNVSFADAYARVENGECWLIGLNLGRYEKAHVQPPDPIRRRKLLLKRREILKLHALSERAGYTLIPLEIYFQGSWAKVKIGVCRGKREYDHRETLKAAEADREIARVMKGHRKSDLDPYRR